MSRLELSSPSAGRFLVLLLASVPATMGAAADAQADIVFDTELVSMSLSGGPFPMPLARDPGNILGGSVDGYGLVNSHVVVTLSSQRTANPGPSSPGQAIARPVAGTGNGNGGMSLIYPDRLDGEEFLVDSFFDVFFDITVTDVDARPGRDFAGQPHGTSITIGDNGPARMASSSRVIFDKDAANFGLIPPPESNPFVGQFRLEIPLGGDINGNGENDKVKFVFGMNSLSDQDRTYVWLPDGTVLSSFNSAAILEGAIVDQSSDPPFTIGAINPNTGLPDPNAFGGPTTGASHLQNPIAPEPSALVLLSMGALGVLGHVWRKRRRR